MIGMVLGTTDEHLSNRLNATEQRELQSRMEKKQMKEFMSVSPPLFWK